MCMCATVCTFVFQGQLPSVYVYRYLHFVFQGQPSYVRVYRYPDFGGPAAAVANKSFYKADRVNMYWNKIGEDLCVCMYI